MRDYISQRVISLAEYIIETKATVRNAGRKFGISKSTVHKDVAFRLKNINYELFEQVRKVLDNNKETRHIRGGNATREKYRKLNDFSWFYWPFYYYRV